jgi:hypothetical protein
LLSSVRPENVITKILIRVFIDSYGYELLFIRNVLNQKGTSKNLSTYKSTEIDDLGFNFDDGIDIYGDILLLLSDGA